MKVFKSKEDIGQDIVDKANKSAREAIEQQAARQAQKPIQVGSEIPTKGDHLNQAIVGLEASIARLSLVIERLAGPHIQAKQSEAAKNLTGGALSEQLDLSTLRVDSAASDIHSIAAHLESAFLNI